MEKILKDDPERVGTYRAYKNAYVSFSKFRGAVYEFKGRESIETKPGRELSPIDITPTLLKDFETHMKENEAGRNTIAIYTRALKVIFNICISKTLDYLSSTHSPASKTIRVSTRLKPDPGRKVRRLA